MAWFWLPQKSMDVSEQWLRADYNNLLRQSLDWRDKYDKVKAENEARRADIDALLGMVLSLARAADTADILLQKDYPAEAQSIAAKVRKARELVDRFKY